MTKKDFTRFKRAAWSGYSIAVEGKPGEPTTVAPFITQLRREVANLHPDRRVATGLLFGDDNDPDIFDQLVDIFDFQELFNSLTNWLIENWPDVLKVVVMLLLLLETAELSEEE